MYMNGAAGVVTRENGLEIDGAVIPCDLDASHSLILKIGLVGWVAVHEADDTTIYTRRVGRPNLDSRVFQSLAGVDIDDLDVHVQVDTFLAVSDILANMLASDILSRVRIQVTRRSVSAYKRGLQSILGRE